MSGNLISDQIVQLPSKATFRSGKKPHRISFITSKSLSIGFFGYKSVNAARTLKNVVLPLELLTLSSLTWGQEIGPPCKSPRQSIILFPLHGPYTICHLLTQTIVGGSSNSQCSLIQLDGSHNSSGINRSQRNCFLRDYGCKAYNPKHSH